MNTKVIGKFSVIGMLLCLILVVSMAPVKAEAATKQKAKASAPTAEEIQLSQLIAYRDALIKMGGAQADIDYANKAIEITQAQIAAKAAGNAAGNTAGTGNAANATGTANTAGAAGTNAVTGAAPAAQPALQPAPQPAPSKEAYDALLVKGFKKNPTGVVFIGDSRFVQMRDALNGYGAIIVAQGWMGHDWMMETAFPEVDPAIGKGCKVVINLGVNDLGNIDKYISDVNAQAALWAQRGIRVYYATVNPREENNYQIDEFNRKLIERLQGITIIDTNTFLKNYGYKLVDNVHYDGATNINIYSYIMSQL